jgi:hypothetical protein
MRGLGQDARAEHGNADQCGQPFSPALFGRAHYKIRHGPTKGTRRYTLSRHCSRYSLERKHLERAGAEDPAYDGPRRVIPTAYF